MEISDTRKAQALALMIEGKKQVQIARTLEVTTRTIRRWSREPEFIKELKEDREALVTIARTQSAAAALEKVEEDNAATKFLARVRDAENLPLPVRMRAAGMLMTQGLRVTALLMKEERAEKRRAEKADKSGHKRGMGVPPMSDDDLEDLSDAQTGPIEDDETGQNRTLTDTPAEHALREAKLEACQKEMEKYEAIERAVKAMKNVNPDALEKFKDDLENARQAIENTMGEIDEAEPEKLNDIQIQPVAVKIPA